MNEKDKTNTGKNPGSQTSNKGNNTTWKPKLSPLEGTNILNESIQSNPSSEKGNK